MNLKMFSLHCNPHIMQLSGLCLLDLPVAYAFAPDMLLIAIFNGIQSAVKVQ